MESLENNNGYILEAIGISKRFSGVTALNNLTIKVKKGEIRALLGENGAGKSTFCNIVTGILTLDEGKILFDGKEVKFTHPKEALSAGIRMVYQERNLIAYFTGAQSICLGLEETTWKFFLDERKIKEFAKSIMEKIGANIPLNVPVTLLSPSDQQMVEIIRAVARDPKLLILDEPTASLGKEEVDLLFKVLRNLKSKGVSIIIITHKLDEVYKVSDTITVLRNGAEVITESCKNLDRSSTIRHMLGRDIKSQYPLIEHTFTEENILEVINLSDYENTFKDINFYIRKGEVVGLYGLVGAGRTEIAQTIYGIRQKRKGDIFFEGKRLKDNDFLPSKLVKKGIYFIPEDRRQNSLFYNFYKLKENLTVGSLDKLILFSGIINLKKEHKRAVDIAAMESLKIVYNNLDQDITELSGGNQQKVSISRWISQENLKLLLMDEPTQGIDVGVKHDVYILIRELAKSGIGILFISSELSELIGVCDRLYIIKEGRIITSKNYEKFDEHEVMEMVL